MAKYSIYYFMGKLRLIIYYTLLYNIDEHININLKIILILFGYLGKSLYLCNVDNNKQHLSLILKTI